ncbi:general substrate transporter [Microthyrium microscopicum]|uniref:General substrate transporter n=1 Tax=Microthyrium microscopicum TaxID=703497 RepID=A0A6A6U178_9PEZI|nr:general substrate transporter [Microthyrium microscopicum]
MSPRFSKSLLRLYFLCAFFALGSFVWGYNIGILATIYTNAGFKKALHKPTASKTGLITAIYYLGTWLSYIFLSHPASDYLGRRYACLVGMLTTCFGAALQTGATGSGALAMMVIGRIFCGLGIAIVSTAVPTYQSEVAPARHRGRYVVMNHIGLTTGIAVAFWVGYAVTFWKGTKGFNYGWRMSIALQFIPATIFMLGLPFVPETPRWLIQHGQLERGRKSLHYFRVGSYTESEIDDEFESIKLKAELEHAENNSWTQLFARRDLFERLWRAALLQFMAQMCGATAMKYYLPQLFNKLGIGHPLSLLISGVESTLKIGCTIIEMFLIDMIGRRATMLGGITVMFFAMLINGALPLAYPNQSNHASDYTCIVFIFFYTFGYSVSFGPAAWVYGSEIFPTNFRARGLNFAASGGAIGSIIVAQAWPVGIQNIGSKTYFIFMAINLVCLPVIYFLYPETSRKSLEGLSELFDRKSVHSVSSVDEAEIEHQSQAPKAV